MFGEDDVKFKESEKIIEVINKNKTINKTIRLYVYKILFNKYQINAFLNKNNILKYKLEKYDDFKVYLQFPNDKRINYRFEALVNENYESYTKF